MNISFLVPLVAVVILFLLARALLFLVQVEGWSMYPTYHHGDRFLALRYWPHRWLRRGQIVVWKLPSIMAWVSKPEFMGPGPYIKRVVGLPGDEVIAPVVKLSEPADEAKQAVQEGQELRRWYIPAGHYFVKGDSPGLDSTLFGPIPLHTLRGVVLTKLPRRMRAPTEPDFTIDPPLFSHPSRKNT